MSETTSLFGKLQSQRLDHDALSGWAGTVK